MKTRLQDLNRLVVKANHASLKIPSLEFEIPPGTQKGSINTLEGFIQMSISELEQDQPARKVSQSFHQLEVYLLHALFEKDLVKIIVLF